MRAAACLLLIAIGTTPALAAPTEPPAAVQPASVKPRIVKDDTSPENRRVVTVVIERRVSESEIKRFSTQIKGRGRSGVARTHLNFFLSDASTEHSPWATATFAPDLKIRIAGLGLEDEQEFTALALADKRPLIGAWLTSTPAAAGMLTLYRENGRPHAEWRFRHGGKSVEELVESANRLGRRFDLKSGGGDNYLLGRSGTLELRQGEQLIATAERIKDAGEKAPAASPRSIAPVAAPRVPAPSAAGAARPLQPSLSTELANRQFQR